MPVVGVCVSGDSGVTLAELLPALPELELIEGEAGDEAMPHGCTPLYSAVSHHPERCQPAAVPQTAYLVMACAGMAYTATAYKPRPIASPASRSAANRPYSVMSM